jgi:hypothetical protein
MPRHLFLNAVGSSLSIEKIFELAGVFDTSLSATAIRCAELLGVSTFDTKGKVVSWAYGVIRKGARFGTDEELMSAVAAPATAKPARKLFICGHEFGLVSGGWNGHLRDEVEKPCSCCNHTNRPEEYLACARVAPLGNTETRIFCVDSTLGIVAYGNEPEG